MKTLAVTSLSTDNLHFQANKRKFSLSRSTESLKSGTLKKLPPLKLKQPNDKSEAAKPPLDPKSRFRSITRTVFTGRHRSSSDDTSSDEGEPVYALRTRHPAIGELVFQLRRYSDAWFRKVASETPEVFIDSIDVEDALNRAQPTFNPQVGFELEKTIFLEKDKLLLTSGRFLCQLDLANCADEQTFIDMNGRVTAVALNENNDMLVVVVDFRRGATLFIKSLKDFHVTKKAFIVGLAASQVLITPDSKKIVLLEVDNNMSVARITAYTVEDGKIFAEVKCELKSKSKKFEVSLCPADEDVVCLLTDQCVNLYRIIPGQLLIFSTVQAETFNCHAWADDVTLAFGSSQGKLLLYRESIALEAIDLGKMHGK
uniref:WD_REPEATS_REGION domain-containing protein n=1 Tax=Bursaphelenchus xylophilus TaxID=6326 RepID=A0A1I7SUY3_BURXY